MQFTLNKMVPLKYRLDLHRSLPEYPTGEDIQFDIISYLVYVIEVKHLKFDINKLRFSPKTLKYIFKENLQSSEFKTKLKNLLQELIDEGLVWVDGKSFYLSSAIYDRFYNN